MERFKTLTACLNRNPTALTKAVESKSIRVTQIERPQEDWEFELEISIQLSQERWELTPQKVS